MLPKPEDFVHSLVRPFTGAEYLASLNDGREVYFDGQRVRDVTTHPALRNTARSLARLYDALHDPATKNTLTCPTDTGSGGYTHRYFRVPRSREDLVASRDAIACWARLSYGWMGRTPDYKAAFSNTLGANPDWYGPFAPNALRWYRLAQRTVPFMNHAIVNPPIDRQKPVAEVKDVYVRTTRETDAGIYVSGAKVVATSAAFTHYNYIGQTAVTATDELDMSLALMVPSNAPGVKMICRASYEHAAHIAGSPFDYPLSSRFDENDAILVLDNVFVPWDDVLIYRDPARIRNFFLGSGFLNGFLFHGCVRFAVKLDFLTGLLSKALRATGGGEFRGNRALLGEMVAYSHQFWSYADAMAASPDAWNGDAVLPQRRGAIAYSVFAPECYARVRQIIQQTVASGLIYLPSSSQDFQNPQIEPYLAQYVRGSNDIDHVERVKIMKLLWDCVGTEFAGRHDLYERNYTGSWETVRLQAAHEAERTGRLASMNELVDQCLSDYNLDGWTSSTWLNPSEPAPSQGPSTSPATPFPSRHTIEELRPSAAISA
jgi:4-hydroxyphenylacetate 3-monooxygenase